MNITLQNFSVTEALSIQSVILQYIQKNNHFFYFTSMLNLRLPNMNESILFFSEKSFLYTLQIISPPPTKHLHKLFDLYKKFIRKLVSEAKVFISKLSFLTVCCLSRPWESDTYRANSIMEMTINGTKTVQKYKLYYD